MLRLKELREEKQLSQLEVANAIATSQRNIGRWETGANEPSSSFVIKLANYFEVSTDYLLGRSNELGIISTNANLTIFETNLLTVVKKLSKNDQFQVLGFAQALAQ